MKKFHHLSSDDIALRDGKVFLPNGFLDGKTRKNLGIPRVSDVYSIPDIEMKFSNSGHLYITPDGQFVGITSQLGMIHEFKFPIDQWKNSVGIKKASEISKAAIKRGLDFHSLTENYLKNKILPQTEKLGLELFNQAKPELDKIDNIHCVEKALWSSEFKIAGRVDAIGSYGKLENCIIDFKSSRKPKEKSWILSYFLQASAYSYMYQERTGIKIETLVIIISNEEGGVQTFIESRTNYEKKLFECLKEYQKLSKLNQNKIILKSKNKIPGDTR